MMFASLTRRIQLWFVLVALLPLVLLGYATLRHNERAQYTETVQHLEQMADKKVLQIKSHLVERIGEVRRVARSRLTEEALVQLSKRYRQGHPESPGYRQAAARYQGYFQLHLDEDGPFYDVFLITAQGEIVYTAKHESDFATNLLSGPYRDSALAQAFRESRMTLESSMSGYEYYLPSRDQAAFIAAPILRDGVFEGVLAFQLDIKQIYQVAADPVGLGATGETVLAKWVDPQHAMFVVPLKYRPENTLREIGIDRMPVPMRRALSGNRGSGIEADYRGTQVVAAWRYLPHLRWGIVVKMDADEAFASIYQQRWFSITALGLVMLLATMAAYFFGRRLVFPLQELAAGAEDIANGNLDRRVAERGTDEVGLLGRAFNRMAANLQSLYRTLEDRIEERTRELNVTNEQLQEEIIEREHVEKAMRDSQLALLRNQYLLNEAQRLGHLGSWGLDLSSGELRWSDEIYRIFELDPAQFSPSYENFLNAIHPDDRDKVNQAYTQSLQDRQPYDVEHRLLFADGRIKWVREHCSNEFDESGKPLRSVGAVQDITRKKLAEEKLRVAAVAFETHEAIMITDANANIIRVNQAFQDITGYRAEEVLGKNPRILSSGRQDKDFYREMWRRLLETGTWTGEIWDRRKNGEIYPKWMTVSAVKAVRGEVSEYVAIFSDITERKKAEEDIRNLAFYDALTQLPNRRLFLDRARLALSVSARSDDFGAVLFLDLDRFKTLNDTLGHDHGDLLLIEVAQRLLSCVREVDTVARLGGDEFVVLLEDIGADEEEASQRAAHVAEKIRQALTQTYQLKGVEYHSSPSIGVSLYSGRDESVDDLLKQADMAMYQAKEAGRNAVRFFNPLMQQVVETRAALEADLRNALTRQQLRLYYQIQVDNEHRPLGAEALIRWIHPERGMVSPAQFIPIAEESLLILEIGQWVLDTACRQLVVWARHEQSRNLMIAVNVSAQQFGQHDFVEQVAAVVHAHHIDPSRLKLELTESVVLNDVADVVAKMHALKALGVRLSLDDFGTGYSSLSYLKQLPLDQLKIDQSFVRDITTDVNDAVLVKTIIDMAQNFRLNVIAEGVETAAQLDFLKRNGCMAYQGYLFSKPVPIEQFETLLQGNQDVA